MKLPRTFTIYDLRFTIGRKPADPGVGASSFEGNDGPTVLEKRGGLRLLGNRQSAIGNRKSQEGIALVITLIMLAITLVMAVAFLALARRERLSTGTQHDTTVARLAADSAQANATAQIIANMLNGVSNAYNLHLLVSTNYINPYGFTTGSGNPTNVNYGYYPPPTAGPLSILDFQQNVSNLWFLPRAPVYIPFGQPATNYDFRYYLDLNENGRFETNYYGLDVDNLGNPLPGQPYLHTGDPEWIGVLEHPDAPHGPHNLFTSRYAFIAVPVGNSLDINYLHNQARNKTITGSGAPDGFMRNQGVGSWEINLAAFLADLNTNIWGQSVGSGASFPSLAPNYYLYEEPINDPNNGVAFADARALLTYRYNANPLPTANSALFYAPTVIPFQPIDAYSDGLLQTTLDYTTWASESPTFAWSGTDNTNHYFAPSDFFDVSKTAIGVTPALIAAGNDFSGRLKAAGQATDTYNRYTYYRMLDQLGSDSTADDGRLNLNYSNAVVNYVNNGGYWVPLSVGVVPGAETNLVPWTPQNFFNAAADQLLRLYTATWFQSNPSNFMITYYGYLPRGYIDATGLGVTNFPNYGVTNQVPVFGLTNIPVLINGSFVYSPAVNRLLQLAANIYDATTNGPLVAGQNLNLPHVFRPIFERDTVGNVFIVGYTNLYSVNGPNTVSGPNDPQLAPPHPITDLPLFNTAYTPIYDNTTRGLVNVYGVPWIIGAKKGMPNFNQFYMVNQAQVTRRLEVTRSSSDLTLATFATNEMYTIGISNNLGVTWWNSYNNAYASRTGGQLQVYAQDVVSMFMTNSFPRTWYSNIIFTTSFSPFNSWPGSQWAGQTPPNAIPATNAFINANWNFLFQSPLTYDFGNGGFDVNPQFTATTAPLPQFGLLITNYLQAYILDGNNVIDYVQLRDPISVGGLNQGLADLDYPQGPNDAYLQWSTNVYSPGSPSYGILNQLYYSGHGPAPAGSTPANQQPYGGSWSTASTPMGVTPAAEAAFFFGFFAPQSQFAYNGYIYNNGQYVIQAPYTPSRTVYSSFLLQANDPLVHYTSSDLNSQSGAVAVWQNESFTNAYWNHSDDPVNQPLPQPPVLPIKGRYQPWGASKQMAALSGVDANGYNMAYKDPLAWGPDTWDFPTNPLPTVGWIGRVHRGTPWQTVYLKSTNVLSDPVAGPGQMANAGINTWARWTGDIQTNMNQFFDANNSAPMQDFLLFDIFTTRFNDNAVRGTLPVNQNQLAAWSALFGGMVTLANIGVPQAATTPLDYTNLIINPAGTMNSALANGLQPPLWQIVNGTNGINATRANTNLFPYQSFIHAGDILATPALTAQSPFLNTVLFGRQNPNLLQYGINDEMYEWLPQQMMGLVRATEPRYVLYCVGQTLRPAPNGTVLSGPYFQLVTNYQVVAESAIRVVVHIDGANTSAPRAVVESYNVLPPN